MSICDFTAIGMYAKSAIVSEQLYIYFCIQPEIVDAHHCMIVFLGSCAKPDIVNAQLYIDNREAPLILEHGTALSVQCQNGLAVNIPEPPICNNGTWTQLPTCVQGN